MPSAKGDARSRQCRRTDEATGNCWIAFDVDDSYSGDEWAVAVTILNHGTDVFAIEYTDAAGNVRTLPFSKGAGLGPPGGWVEVRAALPEAAMIGGLEGGADLRVSSEGDGDEYVHLCVVHADYSGPTATPKTTGTVGPTRTPTATRTPTVTRTQTPTPTSVPTATVVWFRAEADEMNALRARVSALETAIAEMQ